MYSQQCTAKNIYCLNCYCEWHLVSIKCLECDCLWEVLWESCPSFVVAHSESQIPKSWDTMNTDELCKRVVLSANSQEYQDVLKHVRLTDGGLVRQVISVSGRQSCGWEGAAFLGPLQLATWVPFCCFFLMCAGFTACVLCRLPIQEIIGTCNVQVCCHRACWGGCSPWKFLAF